MTDETNDPSLPQETPQSSLKLGVDVFFTSQVAKMTKPPVTARTVERWCSKPDNPLPALHLTGAKLTQMGFGVGLNPNRYYYLIKKEDLVLIPSVRAYKKGTTRNKHKEKVKMGTTNS